MSNNFYNDWRVSRTFVTFVFFCCFIVVWALTDVTTPQLSASLGAYFLSILDPELTVSLH